MVLNLCPHYTHIDGCQLTAIFLGPICVVDLLQDVYGTNLTVYYGWQDDGYPIDTYSGTLYTERGFRREEEKGKELLWKMLKDPGQYL